MKKSEFKLRVRYGETDQMGVAHHSSYINYFEEGRTEWLRKLGFSYKWMEDNNVQLPVISLNINYKAPARYDDEITVVTTLKKIPTYKIEFHYEIFNAEGQLLVDGDTALVFMTIDTKKIIRAPEYLLEKLN